VVAVPLVVEQQELRRSVGRLVDVLLLATVVLAAGLAAAAAWLAGSIARPMAALVGATRRIAAGDYGARIAPSTRDEVATLVEAFNRMAASLAEQRADLERRRDYIEALLAHATTGVISTDPDGRIVTVNPAARWILGFEDAERLVGTSLEKRVEGDALLSSLTPLVTDRPGGRGPDRGRRGTPRRATATPGRPVSLPDPPEARKALSCSSTTSRTSRAATSSPPGRKWRGRSRTRSRTP